MQRSIHLMSVRFALNNCVLEQQLRSLAPLAACVTPGDYLFLVLGTASCTPLARGVGSYNNKGS